MIAEGGGGNNPTNWVSFQSGELSNGSSSSSSSQLPPKHHPSALLEPIELNEIPLNDLEQPTTKDSKAGSQKAAHGAKISPVDAAKPKLANAFLQQPNSVPAVQYQKTAVKTASASSQPAGKEIILIPPAAASNASAGSSASAGPLTSGNSASNGGKTEELKNGKLLTTVFPSNSQCVWFSPPQYDSIKMPPILANKQNSLPASTYADIIRTISSDLRFFSYAVLHSRITPVWLILSIIVLLAVLASSPAGGFPIMIFALVWLCMLVVGLVLCVLIRKYIVLSLRNLLKEVNKVAFQYRIMIGVQDRGQLSCHKVALMFIYFDPAGCKEDVLKLLRIQQANFSSNGQRQLSEPELMQKAEELVCQHSQAYTKAYMKKRFLFPTRPSEGVSDFRPKHCQKNLCLCQYIEREHFNKQCEKKAAPWYERVFAV